MSRRDDPTKARLIFLLVVVIASLAGVAARLVFVQYVQAQKLSGMAIGQRMQEIKLDGERGLIYDRNGQHLAINLDACSIYATPLVIDNPGDTAVKIGAILGVKPSILEAKMHQKAGFVYLARQVDMDKVKQIKELNIKGIDFISERKRYYPCGTLAAQVIGFSGVDNQGLTGMELGYEDILHGRSGKLLVEGDPAGAPIPGGIYSRIEPTDGEDIYLTIDKDIQYKAETEITQLVKDYSAKGGSIIVMNPANGEVYAMASAPTFNPNAYGQASDEVIKNRAVTDTYEPGSTAKLVTAVAGIAENAVGLNEVFYCPAQLEFDGQLFGEYDGQSKGDLDLTGIISQSSNVGSILIGERVGKEKLYKYLTELGLGKVTGIDYPGEAEGIVPAPDEWSATSIATIPYGQGITATPLQMLEAFATVANDGVRLRPHLVKYVGREGRTPKNDSGRPDKKQVVSKDTAMNAQKILINAVEEGTGKNARIQGYEVGGKTGTAQKVTENGYEKGKYVISFAGYIANLDPQLAIIVTVDEPQATGPQPLYAATIAAPVFKTVGEFSIKHLKLPPGGRN